MRGKTAWLLAWMVCGSACGGTVFSPSDGGTKDAGGSDGGASPDGATGASCGGTSAACPAGQYCDVGGICSFLVEHRGTCTPRPSGCSLLYAPTCACDGKVYESPCVAHAAGVDIDDKGGCSSGPDGYVSCGSGYCDTKVSYCERITNDAVDPNHPVLYQYACQPLPPSCQGKQDCACFPSQTPCVDACQAVAPGFVLTCPGG